MTDIKILQNGEKIIFFRNEKNKNEGFVEFTYNEPPFEESEMLYSIYSRIYEECRIKLAHENSNVSDDNIYSLAFLTMKTDKQGRNVWNECLSQCLIGSALYPLAIQLKENTPFIDKIKLTVLLSVLARFGNFTMPHNGE